MQTPVSNTFTSGTVTTGTINPGVIWVGKYYQVGVEAMIPVNRQSGTGVGGIVQLHLFLDDIFPNSIGRPLFGNFLDEMRQDKVTTVTCEFCNTRYEFAPHDLAAVDS